MSWYIRVLRQYVTFSGRARRKEYWYFMLFHSLAIVGTIQADLLAGTFLVPLTGGLITGVYALATTLPTLALTSRRLHDIGRSAWWMLAWAIPVLGHIALFIAMFIRSQRGANEYGPEPIGPAVADFQDTQRDHAPAEVQIAPPAKWPRRLLVTGGLLLALVGGVRYWWHNNADSLIAAGKASMKEGQRQGRAMDEAGCLAAALQRHRDNTGSSLGETISNNVQLRSCLDAASAVDAFCEQVPAESELLATGAWLASSCQAQGLNDPMCNTLFQQLPPYCASPQRQEKLQRPLARPLALSTASTPATAATDAVAAIDPLASDEVGVKRLLQASGVWTLLEQFSPEISAGLANQTPNAALQKRLERVRQQSEVAFAADGLRHAVSAQLSRQLSASEIQDMLSWLTSPTGARMTQLEASSAERLRDTAQTLRDGTRALGQQTPRRQAQLLRLAQASRQAELSTTLAMNLGLSIAVSVAQSNPSWVPAQRTVIREAMLGRRAEMLQQFEQQTLAANALIYASVSDSDLENYLGFLESRIGARYTDAIMKALDQALGAAGQQLSRALTV